MKKSLHQFKKEQLSIEEAANTKGGLRFFTYQVAIYNMFRNILTTLGYNFSHGHETEADGRKHYCIEW